MLDSTLLLYESLKLLPIRLFRKTNLRTENEIPCRTPNFQLQTRRGIRHDKEERYIAMLYECVFEMVGFDVVFVCGWVVDVDVDRSAKLVGLESFLSQRIGGGWNGD